MSAAALPSRGIRELRPGRARMTGLSAAALLSVARASYTLHAEGWAAVQVEHGSARYSGKSVLIWSEQHQQSGGGNAIAWTKRSPRPDHDRWCKLKRL